MCKFIGLFYSDKKLYERTNTKVQILNELRKSNVVLESLPAANDLLKCQTKPIRFPKIVNFAF